MLGSLEKLVAILGTPLAFIYTIGHLAQVVNVWKVETAYNFNFVASWHVVSLLDKSVVIGLGLKYLAWTLLVVVLVLVLLIRLMRRYSDAIPRNATLQSLQQIVLPESEDEDKGERPLHEWWLWLVFSSFVLSLLIIFLWLPIQAFLSAEDDPVLAYLPSVNITIAADPEASSVSSNGTEQTFVSSVEPSYGEARSATAVQDNVVEGILLSHDEQYWYVLSEKGPSEGQVVGIPVSQTSEVRIAPKG